MPNGDGRIPDKSGLVPPQLIGAERVKKVYPPLQWWPLRVMNPWHKLGFLVGLVVANALVVRVLDLVLPVLVVAIITEPFWLAALISLARSFRGAGEPVLPPRVWWRLTSRPRAGFLLATMYLLLALTQFTPLKHSPTSWVAEIDVLFLGVAFLNSSIRLTILRRRPQ